MSHLRRPEGNSKNPRHLPSSHRASLKRAWRTASMRSRTKSVRLRRSYGRSKMWSMNSRWRLQMLRNQLHSLDRALKSLTRKKPAPNSSWSSRKILTPKPLNRQKVFPQILKLSYPVPSLNLRRSRGCKSKLKSKKLHYRRESETRTRDSLD